MTYRQAEKMSYENLIYSQFLLTSVIYKRQPYRCLCYASESDSMTVVIFSRTKSGTTCTRHLKLPKTAAGSIIDKLQSDFSITAEMLDEAVVI